MTLVEIYSKKGCSLCKKAMELINKVKIELPFSLKEVDIATSEALFRKYNDEIPTIFINGKKTFKFKIDEIEFKKKLRRELIKKHSLSKLWKTKEHFS